MAMLAYNLMSMLGQAVLHSRIAHTVSTLNGLLSGSFLVAKSPPRTEPSHAHPPYENTPGLPAYGLVFLLPDF